MTKITLFNNDGEATFCTTFVVTGNVTVLRKKEKKPEIRETPFSLVKVTINDEEARKMVAPIIKEIFEMVESSDDEEEKEIIKETFFWDEKTNTISLYEHCGYIGIDIK